jgi:pimeloyl-ACP methyl ester carboxylesterase
MLGSLRNGELAVVEAAGHLSNVERPEVVSGALVAFVSRS